MTSPSYLSPETRLMLENIARINNDAIWIYALQTNAISCFGEEFYRPFGRNFTRITAPGDWENLVHPEDAERVKRNFAAALADPGLQRTEEIYHVLKTDGTYACISDKIYIDRNEQGAAILVYGLSSDITCRKRQDIEREMRISELTRRNADLKQFSYITSHNLRTPLANLIGLGQLIDETKIPDTFTRKTLEKYKQATLQLNKTLNDLFELLVQNHEPENKEKTLKLAEVFKQVTDSVETKITESEAEIKADFSEGNTVRFNPGFLHSIFLNFLTNAIKYRSPDRKLKINVFTERQAGNLLLHFSDNGLGIDLKKYGDKVFGLYQKFHNHPDSKGLGLHIVATQVKAMGGNVWVNSAPNEGTTFTVQFKEEGYA